MRASEARAGGEEREVPWYRRWFGEEYLELYPHRDQAEADAAVDLLAAETGLGTGDRVLDLGCGAGRHLRALAGTGADGVGLDLSEALLHSARRASPHELLVRADMRVLPFADGDFDAVTSFFTSFGYFDADEDDARVVSEVARVLRRGGHLLLDFLNADRVRANLRPRDEGELNGRQVVQERRLVEDGRAVEKTIRIESPGTGGTSVFRERVRLYSPDELASLLEARGLRPLRWFGDYTGAPLDPGAPRVIVLARAP